MSRPFTQQTSNLKKWVRENIAKRGQISEPLPTTRELGERFRLSNSTAFRALESLQEEGSLWRLPNGRFYPARARSLLERVLPLACLIRKVEHWSLVYQSIMEGVSAACAARDLPLVIWSDDSLVCHHDTSQPPSFASDSRQIDAIQRFLHRSGNTSGVLLDHIWSDAVLSRFEDKLQSSVLVYRTTALPWLQTASLPFEWAAQIALAHLLGRGFDAILPVNPFSGDQGIDQMWGAIRKTAEQLKIKNRLMDPVSLAAPAQRKVFIERLRGFHQRIAVLSPEDHVASLLKEELRKAGIQVPRRVGLISLQGTKAVVDQGITAVAFDFRAIGQQAVQMLLKETAAPFDRKPALTDGLTT